MASILCLFSGAYGAGKLIHRMVDLSILKFELKDLRAASGGRKILEFKLQIGFSATVQ